MFRLFVFFYFLLSTCLSHAAEDIRVLSASEAESIFDHPEVKLGAGTYCLPVNFTLNISSGDYHLEGEAGKTIITSYNPSDAETDFHPQLLNTTDPDLFQDGTYVVANNPFYSFGGGFAHLELPYNTGGKKILYTQGTILIKKNGVWSRHFTGSGFHVRGSLSITGIEFNNCQFYLFSPFGNLNAKSLMISHCRFKNLPRVFSSSLYGARADTTWFNAIQVYPNDGRYRFGKMDINNNVFSEIHTSIIWGCPPTRSISISDNQISNCPTAIAFFTLYQKNYADESWFSQHNEESITGNEFRDIIQGVNSWTVSLIRTAGKARIENNRFYNCTTQILLLYGADSKVIKNTVIRKPSSYQPPAPVIMVKNIGTPVHTFCKNHIESPGTIFISVEGKASFKILRNDIESGVLFSKNNSVEDINEFLLIKKNKIKTNILVNISSKTETRFGNVRIIKNDIRGLEKLRQGKSEINRLELRKNKIQKNSQDKTGKKDAGG